MIRVTSDKSLPGLVHCENAVPYFYGCDQCGSCQGVGDLNSHTVPPTACPNISHSGLTKAPIQTVDYGKGSRQPSPQPWDRIVFSGGEEYGLSVHVIYDLSLG